MVTCACLKQCLSTKIGVPTNGNIKNIGRDFMEDPDDEAGATGIILPDDPTPRRDLPVHGCSIVFYNSDEEGEEESEKLPVQDVACSGGITEADEDLMDLPDDFSSLDDESNIAEPDGFVDPILEGVEGYLTGVSKMRETWSPDIVSIYGSADVSGAADFPVFGDDDVIVDVPNGIDFLDEDGLSPQSDEEVWGGTLRLRGEEGEDIDDSSVKRQRILDEEDGDTLS